MHYHVIENTPGYMPDSEPACFSTRGAAVAYARSLARSLREDGYTVSGRDGEYFGERSATDLGRYIGTEPMPNGCE
jgi:hypothetical protein